MVFIAFRKYTNIVTMSSFQENININEEQSHAVGLGLMYIKCCPWRRNGRIDSQAGIFLRLVTVEILCPDY